MAEEEINTIKANENFKYLPGHWIVGAQRVTTLHFLPFCVISIPILRLYEF